MAHRLCTIKLSAAERAAVKSGGKLAAVRAVEWPMAYRTPLFEQAYVDPGGTSVWGPGPYLKVPDVDPRDGQHYIDRVFCPWGYPPQRVRVMWSRLILTIADVTLTQPAPGAWDWVLTLDVASN